LSALYLRTPVRCQHCTSELQFGVSIIPPNSSSVSALYLRTPVRWQRCTSELQFGVSIVPPNSSSVSALYLRTPVRCQRCTSELQFGGSVIPPNSSSADLQIDRAFNLRRRRAIIEFPQSLLRIAYFTPTLRLAGNRAKPKAGCVHSVLPRFRPADLWVSGHPRKRHFKESGALTRSVRLCEY